MKFNTKLTMLAMAAAFTMSAHAATITYTLTQNGCSGSGGCGTGPFGTITLTDLSSTSVTVTETLAAGERFAGTGAGDALEFNTKAGSTLSGFTAGFAAGPSPDSASTFGTFVYSVTCTTCQGGNAGNPTGPLTFTVTNASGLSIADFVANLGGYFFAADIVGNGNTGNVAAIGGGTGGGSQTPEPATMALTMSGLALVAISSFRKKSKV